MQILTIIIVLILFLNTIYTFMLLNLKQKINNLKVFSNEYVINI